MSDENLFGSLIADSTVFEVDRASSHASASSSDDLRSCSPVPSLLESCLGSIPNDRIHTAGPSVLFTTPALTSQQQQQQWQPQPQCQQVPAKPAAAVPERPLKKNASSNSSGDSGLSLHDSEVLARSKLTNRRAQKRYREKQKASFC